ncbi:peroxiredoxin [Paenibacillus sp. GXUN7292]|uniref:peroxiredoxin n=1 Tax=Paenibacillus sp. GXUN7292 TaxID=3422499 RepID=UPI003D7D61EB
MSEQQVKIGEQVPDFKLQASNSEVFQLSDYRGKKLVIYFYPKDMTPGCTAESCDFRDFNSQYAGLNAEIIGISPDDLASHQQFIEEYSLPFLLLADTEQEVSRMFGVWQLLSWGGKEFLGVKRSTFIIDENGVLTHEWRDVQVEGHAEEVLKALQ